MRKELIQVATCGLALFYCALAQAQEVFTLTSSKTLEQVRFTNSLGTAVQETMNGMIVFEGELTATWVVPVATNPATGLALASVQLLTQVKLFDELPAANEVGNVQGAVAALRDPLPATTTGKYYAWGSTNAVPVGWVPLLQTNGTQFAVSEGATNYLTFVFNYPTNTGNVTYQIYVADVQAGVAEGSKAVTSSTNATAGISGVSLLGVGGLSEASSASGPIGPLSTRVGFGIHDTASGLFMVIDTAGESGSGPIKVYAWVNGAWQLVGEVMADGSTHYEFYALPGSGLVAGQAYVFKIVDEAGNTHTYDAGLTITGTKMESVVFELNTMIVTFNTEMNHDYVVKVADSPGAPKAQWTAQYVSQNVNGTWAAYSDVPFTAGGTATSVKIPVSTDQKKAFFKVFKIN